MKALYFEAHGGTEVLQLGEVPDPRPGPGEVLIQVKASSLNFNDIWARQGMPGMSVPLPHISGTDASGIVRELGAGVQHFKVGDEVVVYPMESCRVCAACLGGQELLCRHMQVWGFQTGPNRGAFAQYACLPAHNLLPKPAGLSWTDAAATTSALGSVWRMLVTRAKVQPGELVLVFGASGGTGSFAVQLVKAMGGVAIAVTSSEAKAQLCKEAGAEHIIRTDQADVVAEVKRITGRRGVDVVFDHAGANTWQQGIASLVWGGRMVICGATEGFDARIDLRHLWNKQLTLLGSHTFTHAEAVAAWKLIEQGRIKPYVTEVIGLADIADAQRRVAARQTMGKIAVHID